MSDYSGNPIRFSEEERQMDKRIQELEADKVNYEKTNLTLLARVKELEAQLLEKHEAGCHAVSGWYDAIGVLNSGKTYDQHAKEYDWQSVYRVFFSGKPFAPEPEWVKKNWEKKKAALEAKEGANES